MNISDKAIACQAHYKPENIKKAFQEYTQKSVWVASKNKYPLDVVTEKPAKCNDKTTWKTFSEVDAYCQAHDGYYPTIALSRDLGLVGIDLDHVSYENLPIAIRGPVERSGTYMELSKSGNGLHVFFRGVKPGGKCKKDSVEIYDDKKFITLTGLVLQGHESIKDSQAALKEIYTAVFESECIVTREYLPSPKLSDQEVFSKCRGAKNSALFEALFDRGDVSNYQGDRSSADMALCSMLAFYTQDIVQLERLMRKSSLKREKWNSHPTYLSRTIDSALFGLTDTYQPTHTPTVSGPEKAQTIAPLAPLGLSAFLNTHIPERPAILPWIREKNTIMIHAWRGIGKTYFSLNLAYAICSGNDFLGWPASKSYKVLYIDGEMPANALQERLANIVKRYGNKTPPSDEYFQLLSSDMQEAGLPYLDTSVGQALIQPFVNNAEVIVLDNLSTLTCNPENEAQSWEPMQQWALAQRRAGKTVILIHHTGKGGAQRGHSKKEDILDIVINLRRPKDYTPEQGARFEVHFEKTRGVSGKQVAPLEVSVEEINGILHWKHQSLEVSTLEQIKNLLSMNLSEKEICLELGISRATYFRHKKNCEKHPV